jgi:hypothetical protein
MRSALVAVAAALLPQIAGCGAGPTSPSAEERASFQLSLAATTVPAGASTEGRLTLSRLARTTTVVMISSSDAVASVPASISVPSGARAVTFAVATRLVAADTPAKISASLGSVRQDVMLQVLSPVAKPPTLDRLALDTSIVRGGQSAQGTVTLTGAAPQGGLSVGIRSSDPTAIVPSAVALQGGSLSATFTVQTRPVTIDTRFEITAAYLDQTRSVAFEVAP